MARGTGGRFSSCRGRPDLFVPFGHGEWLAAHIPAAEAWLLDDDGHLIHRISDVHAWSLSRS